MKIAIQILLWIVIVFLGFKLYQSIRGPIEFNKVKKERYEKVIKNLKDIRNAELAQQKEAEQKAQLEAKQELERIQQEVDACNSEFGKWEQIKLFELTPDIWSVEGGHLTPTMKMKRRAIKEIYKSLYDKIYS